jgi:SAM-dependent methyltransferase
LRKALIDERSAWQQRLQAQLFDQGGPAGLKPRTRGGREALASCASVWIPLPRQVCVTSTHGLTSIGYVPDVAEEMGSWQSSRYAVEWASDDVLADTLRLPRRISTALVLDCGFSVRRVADLGSGQGTYLECFLDAFPDARGIWIDANEGMRELAAERLAGFGDRIEFVLADVEGLDRLELRDVDVITTSRVLHHFGADSLRCIYRTARGALNPGGFLFNLDHVGAPDEWDRRYRRIREQFTGPRSGRVRPHREDYPLPSADTHLELISEAGFETPDVAWRMFYTVLLVARRAPSA